MRSASRSARSAPVGVADESLGVGEQAGAVREEGVRHEVGRHLRLPWLVARGIRVEPVAELELGRQQAVGGLGAGLEARHPAAHAVELAHEHLVAAVGLVDRPRHDRGGVAPPGAAHRDPIVRDRGHRDPSGCSARPPPPRRRRPGRSRGRAATTSRTTPRRRGCSRWARRPGRRRSSPGARRAAGSRWAATRSCPAATRRHWSGAARGAGRSRRSSSAGCRRSRWPPRSPTRPPRRSPRRTGSRGT